MSAAPLRFVVIRSAGSLLQVFDRRANRVLFDHARLQPAEARAEADRLNTSVVGDMPAAVAADMAP